MEKVINSGRYGQVYFAKNVYNDQGYAIKALPKERHDMNTAKNTTMIYNEIANMETVKGHKNIVTLHEVVHDASHVYLVEEWCGGATLKTTTGNMLKAVKDVVDAIHHCHQKNIVFCDLKPDNIVYSNVDQCYKLTDFGSSVAVDPVSKQGIVVTSTPMIAPPEVFDPFNKSSGAFVTFSYDVWSVGVLTKSLYQFSNQKDRRIEDFIALCLEPSPLNRISTEDMRKYWYQIVSSTKREKS